jgi:hypothetical protein
MTTWCSSRAGWSRSIRVPLLHWPIGRRGGDEPIHGRHHRLPARMPERDRISQTFGYTGEQAYLLLGSAPIVTPQRDRDIPNARCSLYLPTAMFDFDIRPTRTGRRRRTGEHRPRRLRFRLRSPATRAGCRRRACRRLLRRSCPTPDPPDGVHAAGVARRASTIAGGPRSRGSQRPRARGGPSGRLPPEHRHAHGLPWTVGHWSPPRRRRPAPALGPGRRPSRPSARHSLSGSRRSRLPAVARSRTWHTFNKREKAMISGTDHRVDIDAPQPRRHPGAAGDRRAQRRPDRGGHRPRPRHVRALIDSAAEPSRTLRHRSRAADPPARSQG